ncbi:MAG TPA: PepSY-associated TM helix domain-containing protein [Candidatus Angelobacter sp.]|nr:PepSY-associated TM helix domain-containing protein [Candidatus Angelobacter sp.]
MDTRKLVLALHRWIGLIAALALLAVGLSAVVLVFETPIDRMLNRSLTQVSPVGRRMPLATISAQLEQAYPEYQVVGWNLGQEPEQASGVFLNAKPDAKPANPSAHSLELAVNPYTGAVLGNLDRANGLAGYIHQFHTRFLAGEVGKAIVGWSAVCLLVLNLTGIILWWRRKVGRFNRRASGITFHFQNHQAVGIYAWGSLMLFAITGMMIHWEGKASEWANKLTGALPPAKMLPADPVAGGAKILDADQLISVAEKAAPGAHVTVLRYGQHPQDPVRVIMKYPEDHTPAGRTNVFLDPYSGKVRRLQDARSAPVGFKIVRLWTRQFHTGDIYGWPSQMVALISTIALPVMAITGPMIWWKRRRSVARL